MSMIETVLKDDVLAVIRNHIDDHTKEPVDMLLDMYVEIMRLPGKYHVVEKEG